MFGEGNWGGTEKAERRRGYAEVIGVDWDVPRRSPQAATVVCPDLRCSHVQGRLAQLKLSPRNQSANRLAGNQSQTD